ncbi:MAG: Crp/Fnr family transcriptional regulator [Candidatus Methylacidiphilales bacterium]|nr:cyclic nucleotide-binding domain-containing protein [Candidatus Methylacidiphilales bacterium]
MTEDSEARTDIATEAPPVGAAVSSVEPTVADEGTGVALPGDAAAASPPLVPFYSPRSAFMPRPRPFLSDVPLFNGVCEDALAALEISATEHVFHRNQEIVREGAFGHHLFILARGSVEVVKGEGNAQVKLAEFKRLDFFGELCLVESVLRTATVRAKEPTLVYSISSATLHKFGVFWPADHAIIIENLVRVLSGRLRRIDNLYAAKAF